jgi:hypothetical protein
VFKTGGTGQKLHALFLKLFQTVQNWGALTQKAYSGIPEYQAAWLVFAFTQQPEKISHEHRAQLLITSAQSLGLDKKYLGSHADLLLSFSCWLDIVQQVSVKNKEFSSLSHLPFIWKCWQAS